MPTTEKSTAPVPRHPFLNHAIKTADRLFSERVAGMLTKLLLSVVIKLRKTHFHPRTSKRLKDTAAGELDGSLVFYSLVAPNDDTRSREQKLLQVDTTLQILDRNRDMLIVVRDDEGFGDWTKRYSPADRRKLILYNSLPGLQLGAFLLLFAILLASLIYIVFESEGLKGAVVALLVSFSTLFLSNFVLKGVEERARQQHERMMDSQITQQISDMRFRITALQRMITPPLSSIADADDIDEWSEEDSIEHPAMYETASHGDDGPSLATWKAEKEAIEQQLKLIQAITESGTLWQEIKKLRSLLESEWDKWDR